MYVKRHPPGGCAMLCCCGATDETIITWTDPDIGTDVALSFQEAQGCSAIWCGLPRGCAQQPCSQLTAERGSLGAVASQQRAAAHVC
jgi:hypothetical protein